MAVLVTGALLEVLLRAYDRARPMAAFSDDKLARYRGRPGADVYGYKLNSRGFKDIEYTVEKPEGVYRILALGDSFVYGIVPYPHNFLTILDDNLNAAGRGAFEVINMGVPGTEPPEYLELFKAEGMRLRPDLVMVFLFVGNDLVLLTEGDTLPRKPLLYSWRFVTHAYKLLRELGASRLVDKEYVDNKPTVAHEKYMARITLNMDKYTISRNGGELLKMDPFADHYHYSVNKLVEIKSYCDSIGARMLVALVPEDVQVDKALMSEAGAFMGMDKALDFDIPNRMLSADLARNGIEYIDLLPHFRAAVKERRERLYQPGDGHWNMAGNRLAADVLLRKLLEKPYIPF